MLAQTAHLTGELQTLLTSAAFAPIDRAFLRITGPDAPRWLNGMVTNSIQALNPGEGNYNYLLNAQGRIQGDCTIYREVTSAEAGFLLETDRNQLETIQQLLDRFIIMDDVELTPGLAISTSGTASAFGMILLGPQAIDVVKALLTSRKDFGALPSLPAGTMTPVSFEGHEVLIVTPPSQSPQAYEIWSPDQSMLKELFHALDQRKLPQASPETLEELRVLEGRPRYSIDIRNTETAKDLPQETNQTHALHFAKGCYLGQEIVERIRSRGQVHRRFTPFRLEGTLPGSFPTALEAGGKPAGELTSAATVSTTNGPVHLALGYARREFLETRASFTYDGGTATSRAPGELV